MSSSAKSYSRSYPAIADSVPKARAELTAFAQAAGVTGQQLDSVRLAASEAITNVVMHAYQGDGPGPKLIQVCGSWADDNLWVLIADDGGGIRPRTVQSTGLGLGLVLIAQLADDFQVVNRGGGGTELRMGFKVAAPDRELGPQDRGSFASAATPA